MRTKTSPLRRHSQVMRFGKVHREQSKRTRTKLEFFPSPPGAPFLLPFFQVCLLCSSQVARTTPDLALWGSGRSWTFNLSNFVNSLLLLSSPSYSDFGERKTSLLSSERCRKMSHFPTCGSSREVAAWAVDDVAGGSGWRRRWPGTW